MRFWHCLIIFIVLINAGCLHLQLQDKQEPIFTKKKCEGSILAFVKYEYNSEEFYSSVPEQGSLPGDLLIDQNYQYSIYDFPFFYQANSIEFLKQLSGQLNCPILTDKGEDRQARRIDILIKFNAGDRKYSWYDYLSIFTLSIIPCRFTETLTVSGQISSQKNIKNINYSIEDGSWYGVILLPITPFVDSSFPKTREKEVMLNLSIRLAKDFSEFVK